jgi:hypothetical protein
MADQSVTELLTDISARLQAMGEQVSDQRIENLVRTYLDQLLNEREPLARKMRFGRDEQLVGSKFARWGLGTADVEFLYDLMVSWQRHGGRGPSEELRNAFQAISEADYLPEERVRAIDRQAIDDLFPRIPLAWLSERDRVLARRGAFQDMDAYQRAVRAMDTAESGYGAQLIGAQYVGELWDAARRESRVFSLVDSFEMTAPTAYLPVEVDFPELLYVSESTTSSASNYATSKTGSQRVQVDAKKFVMHQMWSGELEEDAIIAFVPYLRRQAALALAYYSDSLVVNGDTTNAATGNINLDDADPADTKHYLAFDGIRHAGIVDNTANSKDLAGAITLNALRDSLGRMVDTANKVDWGHPNDPTDLVFLADIDTADRIALLDELLQWRIQASQPILPGEVAQALKHPVIGSMAVSKTEADGKVSTTPAQNTKGQVVTFNRRGFKVGWRRRVKIETERLIGTDQNRIVYSLRLGLGRFTPTGAPGGIESADVIYDVTL